MLTNFHTNVCVILFDSEANMGYFVEGILTSRPVAL